MTLKARSNVLVISYSNCAAGNAHRATELANERGGIFIIPSIETDKLLQEIGHILANYDEYPLDGTLLHAILDENMVGPSIFKDLGDHILYRDPDLDRLGDALLDLSHTEEADKLWTEIDYLVQDGRFLTKFVYADEIAPTEVEDELDRRDRIAREYFGEKPIISALIRQ